jgi:hypothetical protein
LESVIRASSSLESEVYRFLSSEEDIQAFGWPAYVKLSRYRSGT